MVDRLQTRKVVCLAIFGICASVAVLRFISADQDPLAQMPDTPESAQAFICRDCGQVFSLTPRARTELLASGGRIVREEMTAVRRTLLPCPKCGKVQAVVARTCPSCRSPFVGTDQEGGQHLACPDCEAAEAQSASRSRTR